MHQLQHDMHSPVGPVFYVPSFLRNQLRQVEKSFQVHNHIRKVIQSLQTQECPFQLFSVQPYLIAGLDDRIDDIPRNWIWLVGPD